MDFNIKASRISNLTDARYFAAANVKYIGFDFRNETKNKLSIEEAKEIKDWLAGPEYILEFSEFDADKIFEYCSKMETKNIQLPSSENIDNLTEYNIFIESIDNKDLIKTNQNVSIRIESKETFENFFKTFPNAFYNLDFNFEEQKEIIKKFGLKNIEIIGKEEIEVGVKSFDEVNEFFDWLEEIE